MNRRVNSRSSRLILLLPASIFVFGIAGCSQQNKQPSKEDIASFTGDRSRMPASEKQRIQQMQQQAAQQGQQAAQQAAQQGAPKR